MQVPTKQCSKCHLWLPYDRFNSHPGTRDKLDNRCKTCFALQRKGRYDSRKARKNALRREFGITQNQYDQMFVQQNGLCAICKKPEVSRINNSKIKCLAVDHDHKTGDVRALLCSKCNTSLGCMKEDPERIKALLAYAEWCKTREPDKKIIQLAIEMEK